LNIMNTASINPKVVLFIASFAAFIATFNETYLNVAFTSIAETFSTDLITVKWLTTAYMLGAAVMIPISAYLYRTIKTRPLYFLSFIFLIGGSILSALSTSFPMLLAGRIIQSIGTGILIPLEMNINIECAPREKLGVYIGVVISMTTIGPSASIIAAGSILSFFDWRMLFWVYAAVCLVCLICGACLLKNIAEITHPKLETVSVILISFGMICTMYGVSTIFTGEFFVSLLSFILGIIFLVLFVLRQKRLENPLINLQPLKVPQFSLGVIMNMLVIIAAFAMNIILPYYMQDYLGVDPMTASLTIFPAILLSSLFAPVAGRLSDNFGPALIIPLGFVLMGVFTALLAAFISTGNAVLFALLYIPVICGSSIILGPLQSYMLSKIPFQLNPHGVVILSTGFQLAGCIGSSVFTGIYAVFESVSGEAAFSTSAGIVALCMAAGLILSILLGCMSIRERRREFAP
ncbi:MAG: MFS transporter, partial [Methanocorpusculum sp.]|nr:MFS transporter [Methanocorpusculum sp.]